jgi:hypothetical protein
MSKGNYYSKKLTIIKSSLSNKFTVKGRLLNENCYPILSLICFAGGSSVLPIIKLLNQYQKVQMETEIQAAVFLGRALFEDYGSFVDIGLGQMDSDREASNE